MAHSENCWCSHHYNKKQISAIDKLLWVITNKDILSDVSEFTKAFDDKRDDNPFFSHEDLTKRKNKHRAQIRKVSRAWKKEFNERYRDEKWPQFTLSRYFSKEEFTELQRAQILNGLVNTEDLAPTMIREFVGEMEYSFNEVLVNTVNIAGMNEAKKNATIAFDAVEEYTIFNQRLSWMLTDWLDTRLKNIVAFWLENWERIRSDRSLKWCFWQIGLTCKDKSEIQHKLSERQYTQNEVIV